MSWSNPKGFNFRDTSGYVTDGTNETYVTDSGTSYPTTRSINGESVTFGWESGPSTGRDRSTLAGDTPELSGENFNSSGSDQTFRVDLPASGTYSINVALGDAGAQLYAHATINDTSTVLTTLGGAGQPVSGDNFLDATNVTRTSGSNWKANNAPYSGTFSTTIFRLVNKGDAGFATAVAHITITPPSGSSAVLAGSMLAVASESGALSIANALSGAMLAVASDTGSISNALALSGTTYGVATDSATLSIGLALAGAIGSVGLDQGALTNRIALAGGAFTVETFGGALATGPTAALTGAVGAVATFGGALSNSVSLSGATVAVARDTGALSVSIALAGGSLSSSSLAGALSNAVALAGAVEALALFLGSLELPSGGGPRFSVDAGRRRLEVGHSGRRVEVAVTKR